MVGLRAESGGGLRVVVGDGSVLVNAAICCSPFSGSIHCVLRALASLPFACDVCFMAGTYRATAHLPAADLGRNLVTTSAPVTDVSAA